MPTNGWGNIYCNSFSGDTALASGGGGGFDPDYQAVLDYATTQGYTLPSAGQQVLQNQLVVDLKAAGVWSKLDSLAIMATDGDSNYALVDWIRLATMTAFNSPTFTTNQGFITDGVSNYLNTGFNPTTVNGNYTTNEASYGVCVTNNIDNNTSTSLLGVTDSGVTNRCYEINGALLFINTNSLASIANNLNSGFRHYNRSSSTDAQRYVDGVVTNGNHPASSRPNNEFYLGGRNNGGAPGNFEVNEFSVWFGGGNLSAEASDFNTAIQNYISAI